VGVSVLTAGEQRRQGSQRVSFCLRGSWRLSVFAVKTPLPKPTPFKIERVVKIRKRIFQHTLQM